LFIDGIGMTGNIKLDQLQVTGNTPVSKEVPEEAIELGDSVSVFGGKYDGESGIIGSIAAKTCRVFIDRIGMTGNIKLHQVTRSDTTTIPDRNTTLDVNVLAIGADQERSPDADEIAEENDITYRYCRSRSLGPLKTLQDVVCIQHFMIARRGAGVPLKIARFVNRSKSNSLTKQAFMNKLAKLLENPEPNVYIVFFAGHGHEDGSLCMPSKAKITLEDLINAWHGGDFSARNGKKFFVVADSCYSGMLVNGLEKIHEERKKKRQPNLNMAVQSACSATEVAYDETFTRSFFHFQLNYSVPDMGPPWVDWDTVPAKYQQHPDYFSTWGNNKIITDAGFHLRLYRKTD